LAMVKDSVPYILLLNFGYDRKNLFFHSAKEGRKEDRFSYLWGRRLF